jgi:hypothetical protein
VSGNVAFARIIMERRALAPDETGKLAGMSTAGESEIGSRLAREFLRQIDDETTEKMRAWAFGSAATATSGGYRGIAARSARAAADPGRCVRAEAR